ncbi:MAG: protein translocase SEC61 complex subunit gamma [Desulfurococcaceae archaeon]
MERRRGKDQQPKRGRVREFLQSAGRLFRYSRKPKGKEYSLFLKLVGLAILVAGGIAFVIHLIATLLTHSLG